MIENQLSYVGLHPKLIYSQNYSQQKRSREIKEMVCHRDFNSHDKIGQGKNLLPLNYLLPLTSVELNDERGSIQFQKLETMTFS